MILQNLIAASGNYALVLSILEVFAAAINGVFILTCHKQRVEVSGTQNMNEIASVRAGRVNGLISKLGASPYVATVFLSAALVFLVQPMFAKMATPLLGGSPSVWNVSLVCFQAALLLGYAYAHTLNHFVKSVRKQVVIHGSLLLIAGLVLPFQLSGLMGDPDPSQPTLWLIGVFALSIAPPFAVISASAPLIQSWYSRSGRADAHDPYHLYGASNIGSLLGLAAYPLLLEPLFPLAVQGQAWTMGYGALALFLMASGLIASTGSASHQAALVTRAPSKPNVSVASKTLWQQRLWWITLAFIPSSLLVGVTTHIATDVASAPFLWAPPLMLYIGSFIIVFAKRPPIRLDASLRYLPLAVAAAILALPSISGVPLLLSFFLHLGVLFMAALACHGLMAKDRPEASRLTEFYLLMSLGGVLGGAFNALLVPFIFNGVTEYPLMLIAVLLVRPEARWMGVGRTRVWTLAAMTALVIALVLRLTIDADLGVLAFRGVLALAVLAIVLGRECRAAPAIAAACAWGVGLAANPVAGGIAERGFFGVVKVVEKGEHRLMMHGTTLHGAQYIRGVDHLRPTTYYAPEAPIGQVFAAHTAPGRVGVIGLGTGSVACYAREGQRYTYYEIDPLVAKFASDPAYFSYLSSCTPEADIVLGDGRLTLAAEPAGDFELLLIDAFSSDSVPAHLLTREAVALYVSRLSDDGVLVMHVSNKHMSLQHVVARIAGELGVPARAQLYWAEPVNGDKFRSQTSQVIVLAKTDAALARFEGDARWQALISDGKRPWTDNYSNVIGAIWEKIREE